MNATRTSDAPGTRATAPLTAATGSDGDWEGEHCAVAHPSNQKTSHDELLWKHPPQLKCKARAVLTVLMKSAQTESVRRTDASRPCSAAVVHRAARAY